ncbi:hypothetical protein GQ457_03G001460 [Hibiscus cannabinus]
MLRDFKFLRRNASKNEEIENVPVNPRDPHSLASQPINDGSSRPPLNSIQDPTINPKPEPEGTIQSRIDRTPTKPKSKLLDSTLPLKKPQINMGFRRKPGRATSSCYSESNSTQSTPTKSVVSKPPVSGYRNKVDGSGGVRGGNFAALYRGMPSSSSCGPVTVVNTVEVPHFDLKEDPSFWMDRNVQVLIRVRPLNDIEKNTNGYNRCLKQESSQSIAGLGSQKLDSRLIMWHVKQKCFSGWLVCQWSKIAYLAITATGSGKTYTMLGEIEDLEVKPSSQRGMTPRIFEFLFARIQAEEEIRREEKLNYNCKCSFLEIYNEQITDLLDPSATNLLLREDVKKGVYVENLTEFEVQTVSDILKLLSQGEQSLPHSVFTCIIESRWEKDSTTNLRFARLNLVDLAGSERQKTSGAEGERLKEAASINKSLSTLGHVIMILVDVANGKPRHIPYRDSKLTFLLQASFSFILSLLHPSYCCAIETLNTLKFAQRAKLIQNNAVVNEDSTGDVIALQNEIRLLKEELSAFRRQNVSRSLSFVSAITPTLQLEESPDNNTSEMCPELDDVLGYGSKGTVRMSTKQVLNSFEATLAGALRREKMGETSIKKLEAEIEQLNRLVRQREEDTRSSKMMLRFREDKIQRMESLVRGSLPADSFLLEENKALSEEIQLLQAKVDKNPEMTRFALENIRLLDQLRRFQEFYEDGEKEILLEEISKLRDQLLQFLDGKSNQHSYGSSNDRLQEAVRISKENNSLQSELKNTLAELEECRHNLGSCLEENAKLSREINNLQTMLHNLKSSAYHQDGISTTIKGSDQNGETMEMNSVQTMTGVEHIMDLHLELDILKIILQEEKTSHAAAEERENCLTRDLEMANAKLLTLNKQIEDANGELEEAKSVIEALESQQIFSINDMEELRKSKSDLIKLLSEQEAEIVALKKILSCRAFKDVGPPKKIEGEESTLQLKLKRMQHSLENAKKVNILYQNDRAFKASNEEVDEICRQAEAETAEVIVCLQEELALLQQQVQDCQLKEAEAQNGTVFIETELKELQEKVCMLTEDNNQLLARLEMRDVELRTSTEEWELLCSEIENILADGHEELADAGNQLELLSGYFPQRRIWISEKVDKVVRVLSERELLIEELGRCLEDATDKRSELESMLKSLRGAALVINEAQQQECNEKEKEIVLLKKELNEKTSIITKLEDRMKIAEGDLRNASACATVAFVVVNRLSEATRNHLNVLKVKDIQLAESAEMIEEAEKHIRSLEIEVVKSEEACTELRQRLLEEQQHAAAIEQNFQDLVENDILKTQEELSQLENRMKMAENDLRNASTCATVAFVLVNRLSEVNHNNLNALKSKDERLAESAETILSKDALLNDQATMIDEAEKHICSIEIDIAKSEKTCIELRQRLLEEEQRAAAIEQKHEDMADNDILKTQEELSKLRTGVSTLKARMGTHRDFDRRPEISVGERLYSSNDGRDESRSNKGLRDRDVIILLKKEIESAMESLKDVQAEMGKICNEKVEIQLSEKRSKESLRYLAEHVLSLEETMNDFEKLFEVKIGAVHQKINTVEQTMQKTSTHWCQTKEFLELEVGDAKIIATQKALEASCILGKFDEAQDTITEADIIINGLMIANETMKLDIKRHKQVESTLRNERDELINQVNGLQSINTVKDQQLEVLEEQFFSSLTETRFMVSELEGLVTELQTAFSQSEAAACDCHSLKSLLFDSMKIAKSWLEDVWSEIIVKDCAVSVLHLCHLGILLETLTGLNAENGLLQHGLSESNDVIADLREHNSRSRRELEMFRVIRGKLLADIKTSFDQISKKEEETGELSVKLVTFEKKINDLQFQEEVMLQRYNHMGYQLAVLMKDLDLSNTNFVTSLLDQEQLLKDKEVLESQAEISMVDLCTKDFESLILASEMEQMVAQLAGSEKKLTIAYAVLDDLKQEIVLAKADACLKEQLMVEREGELSLLQEKVEEAQIELSKLKQENCLTLQDLDKKKSDLQSSISCLEASNLELQQLKEKTSSMESCIMSLQTDLELKVNELKEARHSQSILIEDLGSETQDFHISIEKVNMMREENAANCVDSMENICMTGSRLFSIVNKEGFSIADKVVHELHESEERISKFIEELEFLENRAEELESENMTLHAELSRKDEVLKGLLFDLSLLQESASNTKDQKDEIAEMVSSLEALEDELAVKSIELDEAVNHGHVLEVQLQEKLETITGLHLDITRERESLQHLYSENQELKSHIEDVMAVKSSLEDELRDRKKITKSLKVEISEMSNTLSQMNDTIEFLSSNLHELSGERDELHMEVLSLEEKLRKAQAEVKQSEAIAMEVHLMAESKKTYAEEKEAEIKLLERSVEELDCTINVLENKVDIIKGEAERLQLQREELEFELDAVKVQMQNVKHADADMKRCLDEKKKDLEQALDQIQILETELSDKDREIAQCKTHISELNLHAEAQAKEYTQKFKALEAMVVQVKPEGYSTNVQSHSLNKLEKNVSKPRGSGSPFKCIGLGLAQQMKLEKDEDLTAARLRIEELESLAANRQKEIFSLNTRLAAAESMTHDVIRDLLGVKLDMTNYVTLLDNQQVQKIAENARLDSFESQVKDHEVAKLKQQLNEFVEERRGWLEEINIKQAELVTAEVSLEKFRQRDQLLKTENEMLKMENVNYKKKLMELEGEPRKLSGQQNLQQRIHHHAKTKEENNMLKIQNEELGAKLGWTEVVLSRVRDELAHYRASVGKSPYVNFDEEQRLNNKLRESDEDRVQLAHKLLGLCTSVLKAAGITMPISDVCPAAAEEALEQLQNKVISLERELQSLTLENKIYSERNRLSELMPQTSSPATARTDENCHTLKRVPQAPFLSTLDR